MQNLARSSTDDSRNPSLLDIVGKPPELPLRRRRGAESSRAIRDGSANGVAPRPSDRSYGMAGNVFRRDGDYWTIAYEGRVVHLKDLKGLAYLAHLLRQPGRDCHALDLVAAVQARPPQVAIVPFRSLSSMEPTAHDLSCSDLGDCGPMLDGRARTAYRRRLTELRASVEEAWAFNDVGRASAAEEEIESLTRELARGFGLSGRDRRAGSASERARLSVTRAIKTALLRVERYHPTLGLHLCRTIRTGTFCSYDPDPRVPIAWIG